MIGHSLIQQGAYFSFLGFFEGVLGYADRENQVLLLLENYRFLKWIARRSTIRLFRMCSVRISSMSSLVFGEYQMSSG